MILIWLLTIIFLRLLIWINNGNKLNRKKYKASGQDQENSELTVELGNSEARYSA